MIYSRIASSGSSLPKRVVSNDELSTYVDTSDEWITERTGIRKRHVAASDETTVSLALAAARSALSRSSSVASDIDCIIVATSTPDRCLPATACSLQYQLGCPRAAAFDIQAACAGFVHALVVADSLIRSGQFRLILVVGAEIFSRFLDWRDRSTCVLFGDGAGAVLLAASSSPGIVSSHLACDGQHIDSLSVPAYIASGQLHGHPYVHMEGRTVFKLAVHAFETSIRHLFAEKGIDQSSIDWFVPHQANLRIIESVAARLGIAREKVVVTLPFHGNTSAASVPLAFDWGCSEGFIQKGHRCLFTAFGSGLSWGSVLLDV